MFGLLVGFTLVAGNWMTAKLLMLVVVFGRVLPDIPDISLGGLIAEYGKLIGVAALIAILINILKYFGAVKDGTSQTWSTVMNLIGVIGLLVLKVFRPDLDVEGMDELAAGLANFLVVAFGFFLQIWSSRTTHSLLAGTPLIGKSFAREAGEK